MLDPFSALSSQAQPEVSPITHCGLWALPLLLPPCLCHLLLWILILISILVLMLWSFSCFLDHCYLRKIFSYYFLCASHPRSIQPAPKIRQSSLDLNLGQTWLLTPTWIGEEAPWLCTLKINSLYESPVYLYMPNLYLFLIYKFSVGNSPTP